MDKKELGLREEGTSIELRSDDGVRWAGSGNARENQSRLSFGDRGAMPGAIHTCLVIRQLCKVSSHVQSMIINV